MYIQSYQFYHSKNVSPVYLSVQLQLCFQEKQMFQHHDRCLHHHKNRHSDLNKDLSVLLNTEILGPSLKTDGYLEPRIMLLTPF